MRLMTRRRYFISFIFLVLSSLARECVGAASSTTGAATTVPGTTTSEATSSVAATTADAGTTNQASASTDPRRAPRKIWCLSEDAQLYTEVCGQGAPHNATVYPKGTKFIYKNDEEPLSSCDTLWLTVVVQRRKLYTDKFADCADVMLPPPGPGSELPLPLGAIIGIAVAGGLCLLCVPLIVFCVCRRRGKQAYGGGAGITSQESFSAATDHELRSPANGGFQTQTSFNTTSTGNTSRIYSTFKAPQEASQEAIYWGTDTIITVPELNMGKEIGRGGYGVVYIGNYKGMKVAIKSMTEGLSAKEMADFRQEAKLLARIPPHPHVVKFVGLALQDKGVLVVLEFLGGGSLIHLIESNATFTRQQILRWLRGVAQGMIHLRSHNIIHRDLAARNILLTEQGDAKVTDFGMSRFVDVTTDASHVTKSNVGPLKWMAPESLLDKEWSEKTDVWAYGVLIFEILEREEPYADLEPVQVAAQVCRDGIQLQPPPTFGQDICDLLHRCMIWEAPARPTFKGILDQLNTFPDY